MTLKLCQQCRRPFMASEEFCPRCPRVEWDQESLANLGCILATILPLFVLILFWLIFLFSFLFDISVFLD